MPAARETCALCGYPCGPEERVLFPVPLASPPQTKVVCRDCLDDLRSLAVPPDRPEPPEAPHDAER